MPLFRINADACGVHLHDDPSGSLQPLVAAAARARSVVIMVHGFKYSPFGKHHCPHSKIFAPQGWPAAFGADRHDRLVVAFGWHARGPLSRVHQQATIRSAQLACLIRLLRQSRRPVHLVAHSLGATVSLAALPYLAARDVGRVLLLSGAAHHSLARHALGSPAGACAQVVHVTSGENAIYDRLFEAFAPGDGSFARAVTAPNLHTLMIDQAATRSALAAMGFPLGAPRGARCHWSSYTCPGVMALNDAILSGQIRADTLPLPARHAPPPWRETVLALLRQTRIMRATPQDKGPPHGHAY